MRLCKYIGIIAVSLTMTACAISTPPVNVTRFHNAQDGQIPSGSFAIAEPAFTETGDQKISLQQRTFNAAVIRELQRLGFTEANSGTSIYSIRISVEQERITAGGQRSPVSVGVGGSTGSYGSGVGVGIGINLSGAPKDIIATEMSVRITRRADNQTVWEGRSSVEAKDGSPASQPALAASKLAEALFRDFPGVSGTTTKVP